jgi:5-methylcytosine-specific restriction endonuclease McrA
MAQAYIDKYFDEAHLGLIREEHKKKDFKDTIQVINLFKNNKLDRCPFCCPYDDCNFWCITENSYKRHIRFTHNNEKKERKHKCFKCPNYQEFSRRSHLTRHDTDVHHINKVYECVYCKYISENVRNLKQHLRSTHNQKICKFCNFKGSLPYFKLHWCINKTKEINERNRLKVLDQKISWTRSLASKISRKQRNYILHRDKLICRLCKNQKINNIIKYSNFHCDHVICRAEGGLHKPENVSLLCVVCHSEKTNKEQRLYSNKKQRLYSNKP